MTKQGAGGGKKSRSKLSNESKTGFSKERLSLKGLLQGQGRKGTPAVEGSCDLSSASSQELGKQGFNRRVNKTRAGVRKQDGREA